MIYFYAECARCTWAAATDDFSPEGAHMVKEAHTRETGHKAGLSYGPDKPVHVAIYPTHVDREKPECQRKDS